MAALTDLPPGLGAEALRTSCDPKSLGFGTTDDLPGLERLVGQERATDALRLSVQMSPHDFNAFVLGREGYGRHRIVQQILAEERLSRPVPFDWAYVNDFQAPHKPKAIRLPPGTAQDFKRAMQDLIDDLGNDIPALFESDEYQTQRRALEEEFGSLHERAMADFAEEARAQDVALIRTPMGFMLTAIVDGKVVKPDVFENLDAKTRKEIEEKVERLQEKLAAVLRRAPKLEKEHRQRLEQLHASMAERIVSERLQDVIENQPSIPELRDHLSAVHQDIVENADVFLAVASKGNDGAFPQAIKKYHQEAEFGRYAVNVMISHEDENGSGAPVVTEELPTLGQLIGRIEHVSQMGALVTNFMLIKPGALHRANGGYLVLDARQLLTEPFAWDALKRCLRNRAITITSMADRLSVVSTVSLEPDPIPLDLRVILVGDRLLHALLTSLDPDFSELFKIQADFDDVTPRSEASMADLAGVIASFAKAQGLRPISAAGVARLLDEAVRRAEDTQKLSLHLGALNDRIREADHYADLAERSVVEVEHVETAVMAAEKRASRIKERIQEAITRETILIETEGTAIGQINGLSVYDLGTVRFGRPSRITARVRMGTGKFVDIEREVELGGPLHSKGVLILSAYLSASYALDVPMSLHASIVFEQSYGGVDGDSASSAELYALLSALSGLPIRQGLAITGSVNQRGEVQAIGGVNEKIEGFFDICKARGLTGDQGVLIPKANVEQLMLRQDVVDAVRSGSFRVIPVSTINEGIEILTGAPVGMRGSDGAFPPETVSGRVEARLRDFAQARRKFTEREKSGNDEGGP